MAQSIGVDRQGILQAIFSTIDDINEILPDDRQLEKSVETRLFGMRGGLESLEFVNFIVLLEQRIAEEREVAVTLADEKAISRETSPFSTVEKLADYIIELLQASGND